MVFSPNAHVHILRLCKSFLMVRTFQFTSIMPANDRYRRTLTHKKRDLLNNTSREMIYFLESEERK